MLVRWFNSTLPVTKIFCTIRVMFLWSCFESCLVLHMTSFYYLLWAVQNTGKMSKIACQIDMRGLQTYDSTIGLDQPSAIRHSPRNVGLQLPSDLDQDGYR